MLKIDACKRVELVTWRYSREKGCGWCSTRTGAGVATVLVAAGLVTRGLKGKCHWVIAKVVVSMWEGLWCW